jgi:transcription elongation factor SPT4
MKGSQDRITSCTTTQFDGVISVIDPDSSWVARWQRTGSFDFFFVLMLSANLQISAKYVRGIYAVRVTGRIPEDVELELERRNIKYRPRDQTDQD